MKISINPKPQSLFNAFLLFFVIHSAQLGVGIHGFQRIIFFEAKHDAWISVIIGGLATNFIAFIMIKTLELYPSSDLYGIQYDLFGKWIGYALNLVFVLYWLSAFYVVARNYMEVIQAWIFPDLPAWFLAFTLLLLVAYGVSGGLRTIVGVCFFSVVLSLWFIPLLAFPMKFANFDYLLPIFEADVFEILKGARQMTFTVLGFELIFFIYPFVKEKEKVNKYTQLGLWFTTVLYAALMVVSLAYFSSGQIERTVWGTLSLFKIVRLPFIERFEYVAISYWIILILPNMMFFVWAASRGIARMWNRSEKNAGMGFLLLMFLLLVIPMSRLEINLVNNYYGKIGFYMVFCYPILLYMTAVIKKRLSHSQRRA